MDVNDRYLFHWLKVEKLEEFHTAGILNPGWTHWILDADRFVKGTSTTDEPMLWTPDEDMKREPCLVLDRARIDHPIHAISSSESYYLTKDIRRLKRARKDFRTAIDFRREMRKFSRWTPDEYFVEGPISWDAVVLIGFEDDEKRSTAPIIDIARRIASERGLGMLDLTGWTVGSPCIKDTVEIIEEAIGEAALSPRL